MECWGFESIDSGLPGKRFGLFFNSGGGGGDGVKKTGTKLPVPQDDSPANIAKERAALEKELPETVSTPEEANVVGIRFQGQKKSNGKLIVDPANAYYHRTTVFDEGSPGIDGQKDLRSVLEAYKKIPGLEKLKFGMDSTPLVAFYVSDGNGGFKRQIVSAQQLEGMLEVAKTQAPQNGGSSSVDVSQMKKNFDRVKEEARKRGLELDDFLLMLLAGMNFDLIGIMFDLLADIAQQTSTQVSATIGKLSHEKSQAIQELSEELDDLTRNTPDNKDIQALNDRAADIENIRLAIQQLNGSGDSAIAGILESLKGSVEKTERLADGMHTFYARQASR